MKQIKDVEKLKEGVRYATSDMRDRSYYLERIFSCIDSLAVEVEPEPTPINDAYMCCVCGNTPVDVASGFDTCENCAEEI